MVPSGNLLNQLDWSAGTGFTRNGSSVSVSVGVDYLRVGCYRISAIALKRIVDQAASLLYPESCTEKTIT